MFTAIWQLSWIYYWKSCMFYPHILTFKIVECPFSKLVPIITLQHITTILYMTTATSYGKTMWTPDHHSHTYPFKNPPLTWSWFTVAVMKAFTLRLSTGFWSLAVGVCATRTLVRSSTDVKWGGLVRSQHSNSSQQRSVRLRSELGQLEFFHTNHGKPCFYGACFVHRGTVMLQQVWVS